MFLFTAVDDDKDEPAKCYTISYILMLWKHDFYFILFTALCKNQALHKRSNWIDTSEINAQKEGRLELNVY